MKYREEKKNVYRKQNKKQTKKSHTQLFAIYVLLSTKNFSVGVSNIVHFCIWDYEEKCLQKWVSLYQCYCIQRPINEITWLSSDNQNWNLFHNLEKATVTVKTEEKVLLWENAQKDNQCLDYQTFPIIFCTSYYHALHSINEKELHLRENFVHNDVECLRSNIYKLIPL